MSITIEATMAKHVDDLMAQPTVVSVGIGLDDDGNPAIVVGVTRATEGEEVDLPTSLDGHPVVVRVVGEIRAR
jgi:hypothetical protein